MTQYETLTTQIDQHVMLIGLNRPEKKNAFNVAMLQDLSSAYAEFEGNSEMRCAVLFANGDNFTTGLDLAKVGPKVMSGQPLFPEGGLDPLDLFDPRRTKPVVFAAQGWCLTIGVELALACDIRLAAEGTRFSQMEVKRGIMPFGGATMRLPLLSGWGNAMYHLLSGDEFGPAEALRIGLVQEVVPAAQLLARATELAHCVAKQAPLAVQAARKSARIAVEQGFDAAKAEMMVQAKALMTTDDATEGMMSFVERREAKFKGS